ncbi:hypothetical protein HPO96_16030 [Kribbella sandramycini]|uniref:DUF4245 domain-containing protein n=1 Tax=Kribbella sandramycini TaxID=60450 RepID=A0A7Y4L1F4_9ACTN|nr:hypothetical protein [Kribbella sandramycini]MBB6565490.1 hypothetical protein [Kribbella sandramycini]NOL41757.1 hypothetical protein [Kribbella sandramycini]
MTDLKFLLDDAAGAEPAVTDTDLTADLDRGRRAVRRRRVAGIGAGAVATAVVIGIAWAVFPGGPTANTLPEVVGTTSQPTTEPTNRPTGAKSYVPLAVQTTNFPGGLTCNVVPFGWTAKLLVGGEYEQIQLYDPKLPKSHQQYNDDKITLRWAMMRDEGNGLVPDKFGVPWTELPHVKAGSKDAVITPGPKSDGLREVFVRQSTTGARVIVVTNDATTLGWDEATLLKFAGSCRYRG